MSVTNKPQEMNLLKPTQGLFWELKLRRKMKNYGTGYLVVSRDVYQICGNMMELTNFWQTFHSTTEKLEK